MVFPPEVRQRILSHQVAVRHVRRRVESFVRRVWSQLPSHRDDDIDRLVAAVVPVVLGGQRRMVALTDAYLAAVATASGVRQRPMGIPPRETTGAVLRGVDPTEVYRRPGMAVWTALAAGTPYSKAVSIGESRLVSLATTDLQLAKFRAVQWRQQRDSSVVGYRRVLSGSPSCALCVIASTQRYRTGELAAIHPGCGCDVAEIRGDIDPGQVIDSDRLEQMHAAVEEQLGVDASRSGSGYLDIAVREHGEYGPTLTWRGQDFTGPADI